MERDTYGAATAARALEGIGQILVPPGLGQTLRAAVHAAALAVAAATAPRDDFVVLMPRPSAFGRGRAGRGPRVEG